MKTSNSRKILIFLKEWPPLNIYCVFLVLLLKTISVSSEEQIAQDHPTTRHFDAIFVTKHRKGELKEFVKLIPPGHQKDKLEFYISLDQEVIDIIQDSIEEKKEDKESDLWQNYIVRKSNWNKLYASIDQKEYGKMMNASVRATSRCIKEKGWDFDTALRFLAIRRSDFAQHHGKHGYGQLRTCVSETRCNSAYLPLAERLWEICEKIQKGPSPSQKLVRLLPGAEGKIIPIKPSEKEAKSNQWQFFEKIDNEKQIALSIVDFRDSTPMDKKNTIILHTHHEKIPEIMLYVSRLYEEAMKENDSRKLTEKLGKIFWWICQAKPWDHGDPSIAEMLIRSILTVKGKPIRPWKEDLIPWMEVMAQPDVEIFSRGFPSFFE